MKSALLIVFLILSPLCGLCEGPSQPPLYETIMKIIDPLEYSVLPVMIKPQAEVKVDFNSRHWTLRNIHEYDAKGHILLEDGRYGLCAELATYVFEKLQPLLDARYELKFAMVTEATFFAEGQSNHIVLLLVDKPQGQIYLIDPSFHKYARMKELSDYRVLNIQDTLSFVKDQSHDATFSVNQAIPLYIKGDFLLSFSVTSIDDKFDKSNFIFVISASRNGQFTSRDILVIGRRNNEFQDFEDATMFHQLLNPEETSVLFDRLKTWIKEASQ